MDLYPRHSVVSYRNSTSNHNSRRMGSAKPTVVSYRNSTSNHNYPRNICLGIGVVSYRNSTSNHNNTGSALRAVWVVSYRNSTSNHNCCRLRPPALPLYLIEILHQTTTFDGLEVGQERCILSKFYIKPQLCLPFS